MTKLSNVKGRITYISSYAKQENLYAVYETTERKFWRELAKCNQEEFVKSGTEGKCIEARELIIALPESFTEYQPDRLLQLFTNHFKQNYGTECIAALHHNKRKTNYHIHLIFAERKLLDEPIVKTASRNMFYDENGKHVRTKKEILGEDGEIREDCHIVKKGEVYEKKLFTAKDERFKSNSFLDEVKHSYTDLINIYVKDENQKLQVFERGSVYLATKKIGKNNPKAQEIEADNQKRREWNRAVDMALISGVPEPKIMEVKRKEITEPIRESIVRRGNRPRLFFRVVTVAVEALEFLIASVLFKKPREVPKQIERTETEHQEHVAENSTAAVKTTKEEKAEPEQPKMTRLASKYPKLFKVNAQVQQVFIRKAYSVLTNHRFIKENSNFATQLVISTHSSHIARESNFADLRYFKRLAENSTNIIATSKVINLSDVFGENDETDKFVTRYLQTTHCDLFFADAVILVEGSAENMLVPHFIRNKYPKLYQRYISILSINGRHSHRLNPLIEKLCIPTLVIADIDSAEATGHHKAIFPERGKGEISSNYTITQWLLKEKSLDNLLSLPFEKKELLRETPYKYPIRVAYQTPVIIDYGGDDKEAIASTFEDCLVYTNYKLFKELSIDDTGSLIKSVCDEINSADSFETFRKKVYETLRNGKSDQKAEFALDLIYAMDPNELTIPTYIDEGLAWLQTYLDPEE